MRRFAGLAGSIVVAVAAGACGGKPTPPTTPAPKTGEVTQAGGGVKPAEAGPKELPPLDKAACANRPDMLGPFALDEAQAEQRYGQNAQKFTDAPTTKARAIEVCGIPASRQWLRGTACADGSPAKQNGRVGSVGPGGRCGAIIDLYTVTCPEGSYQVFIDIYMCGPDESMR
jgi:hypothetical protein